MRNFQNEWQTRNQGNLAGSAEAFNRLHPAQDYAKTVLAEMGLTAKGFASPEAKARAQALGYLAKDDTGASPPPKTRRPLTEFFGQGPITGKAIVNPDGSVTIPIQPRPR
jgi:hypothetical protein